MRKLRCREPDSERMSEKKCYANLSILENCYYLCMDSKVVLVVGEVKGAGVVNPWV